jgi:hypothetical protein
VAATRKSCFWGNEMTAASSIFYSRRKVSSEKFDNPFFLFSKPYVAAFFLLKCLPHVTFYPQKISLQIIVKYDPKGVWTHEVKYWVWNCFQLSKSQYHDKWPLWIFTHKRIVFCHSTTFLLQG